MRLKTFLIILAVAAAVTAGLALGGGSGHRMVAKWLPAIHGGGSR